ncbi:MAG: hypothetical protein KBC11_00245 [Candidatus Pacebacteria bacterium]|nr:hypothetical protein [Candidatus Paceibacterota bacterium]
MIPNTFIVELKRIKDAILSDNDELIAFKKYVKDISAISPAMFSNQNWPKTWRQEVYSFGEVFEKKDAGPYIYEARFYTEQSTMNEIVSFIYSEIIWNYFERAGEYNREILKKLIDSFPHNPEFHHTYGHFLNENKNREKALFEYQRAINIDPVNITFISSYYACLKDFFEDLINKHSLDQAEQLLDKTFSYLKEKKILDIPRTGRDIQARLASLKDRITDHKAIDKQVIYFQKEIENTIRVEQRRLIETLGIFSAILAFIITNVSIGLSNLGVKEMMFLMFGMALVLLIFAVAISYLFGPKLRHKPKFYHFKRLKFWVLLAIVVALFLLYKLG